MVIGSGIFFRADNILGYTKGNVTTATIAWLSLGITLIFASLCVAFIAQHTKEEGGTIGYMKEIYGSKVSFITGWFETIVYIPCLTALLATIGAKYAFQLIGFDTNVVNPIYVNILAIVFILLTYFVNYLGARHAALFSSFATVIKLIPIAVIGLIGLVHTDTTVLAQGASNFEYDSFTSPLLSMSFAFAGWLVVGSMARDMENPQRDLSKVLAINLIIVTVVYTTYFFGISMLMPANEIIAQGDAHVGIIAQNVLGSWGGNFVLFCVMISCLGTLNAKFIAGFKYNHALGAQRNLPYANFFVKETKRGTNFNAGLITFFVALIWWALFTIQSYSKFNVGEAAVEAGHYIFAGITFDDIPVVFTSIEATVLIIGAIILARRKKLPTIKLIIFAILGLIGQVYCIISYIQTNSAWLLYTIITIAAILIGLVVKAYANKTNPDKLSNLVEYNKSNLVEERKAEEIGSNI